MTETRDAVSDFKSAEAARSAALAAEHQAIVDHVKAELREGYLKAKMELPRVRDAIARASAFLDSLGDSHYPAPVVRMIAALSRAIATGDKLLVAGIAAYENLTFGELKERPGRHHEIRMWLNQWDGRAEGLASLRGQIETALRELTPPPSAKPVQGEYFPPEPKPLAVQTEFEPRR